MKVIDMIPAGNAPYGYSMCIRYLSEQFGSERNEMSLDATIFAIQTICKDASLSTEEYDSPGARRFSGVCDFAGAFYLSIDIQP